MITSLASFAGQFPNELIEKGQNLFDQGQVETLRQDDKTWRAHVNDNGKRREAMVRAEKSMVTDIFCTCSPNVCPHVIAVFFALQKKFKIKPEKFDDAVLQEEPVTQLGNRINNLVYVSRRASSKDGELEKLGINYSLKDLSQSRLQQKAVAGLGGYDGHPVFNGAKILLGAAIREYSTANYEAVREVAKAILTGICKLGIMSNSAVECCNASVELLNELHNAEEPSSEFRNTVFDWVFTAL